MNRRPCELLALVSLLSILAAGSAVSADSPPSATVPPPAVLQKIGHVFIIVLENKNYDDTFGTSTQDPYLQKALPTQGALLTQYFGTGHNSLDNYIALISGQASSPATEADCEVFSNFVLKGMAADGQAAGDGCVYPASIKTLADQLEAKGLRWKGYMEDMGNDPAREHASCGHPPIGAKDLTQNPQAPTAGTPQGDQYAARHNPFVYFHSVIDRPSCNANDVNLSLLDADLASLEATPNLVFITPNLCSDGHDGSGTGALGQGCVDGKPGGLTSSDAFLKIWVQRIMASAAYQKDGLIIITFDESNVRSARVTQEPGSAKKTETVTFAGEHCCNQLMGPNITRPTTLRFNVSPTLDYVVKTEGYGGDRIGAVLLSRFIKPGTTSVTPYNHYALLKTLENIYGVGYLGYAGQKGLAAFGDDVFTNLR